MVWVYDQTQSLPVVILMNAGFTASALILEAPVAGESLLLTDVVTALIWWVAVAGILVADRLQPDRLPLSR
ncbi:MAG TPA: hypothetical protein VGK53_23790 [Propionicimonas sp.]